MVKGCVCGIVVHDPRTQNVNGGKYVCNFDVVSNNNFSLQPSLRKEPVYVHVAAWESLGALCAKMLVRGKRVIVTGEMKPKGYMSKSGEVKADIELVADGIEIISKKGETEYDDSLSANDAGKNQYRPEPKASEDGFIPVTVDESEIPF